MRLDIRLFGEECLVKTLQMGKAHYFNEKGKVMKRIFRTLIFISPLIMATFAFLPTAAQAADKPNIVLVFMDNFGWGEPGFNGGGIIRGAPTPRLDKLASEGLRLTNFILGVVSQPQV